MILKMLVVEHIVNRSGEEIDLESWRFYDNITNAKVYYERDLDEHMIAINIADDPDAIHLVVQSVAYLMNDKGQTIEKIYADRRGEPIEAKAV